MTSICPKTTWRGLSHYPWPIRTNLKAEGWKEMKVLYFCGLNAIITIKNGKFLHFKE